MQSLSLARAAEPPSGVGVNGHATVTVPGTRRFPTESNNRINPQLPAIGHRPAPELLLTRPGFLAARFRSIETVGQTVVKQNRHSWTKRHEKPISFGLESRSNTSPRPKPRRQPSSGSKPVPDAARDTLRRIRCVVLGAHGAPVAHVVLGAHAGIRSARGIGSAGGIRRARGHSERTWYPGRTWHLERRAPMRRAPMRRHLGRGAPMRGAPMRRAPRHLGHLGHLGRAGCT